MDLFMHFYSAFLCLFVMSISSKVSSELFALKDRSCYTPSSKVIDINSGCMRVCIQSSSEDDRSKTPAVVLI